MALVVLKLVLLFYGMLVAVGLNLLITPLFLAGLWGLARPVSLPCILEGGAFPIYLLHGVILPVLRNAGGTYRLGNPWLELVMGVVVPFVVYRLMDRCFPRLSAFFFGGR